MPTYEYECGKCAHRFEEFQSITEPPLKVCPECGGEVRRLIGSGAGILFKGSGFYETDYRSSSYKKGEKAERPGNENTSSKSGPDKKEPSSEK
jgi:putative FmdB family regulatory protein